MRDGPKVAAARIEVERTRAGLIETARELQARLQPKVLATDVWEKAKESAKNKGADLAVDAVDAVRKRPVAAGGVIAALTMFLAREPIRDAAVRIYDAMTSDDEPSKPKPALKTARKPAARTPRRRAPVKKTLEKQS